MVITLSSSSIAGQPGSLIILHLRVDISNLRRILNTSAEAEMGCSLRLGEGDQFVSHVLILENVTTSAPVQLCKPVKISFPAFIP